MTVVHVAATLIDPASTFGILAAARPSLAVAERIAWRNAAELFGIVQPWTSESGG